MHAINLNSQSEFDPSDASPDQSDVWLDVDLNDADDMEWLNIRSGLGEERVSRLVKHGRFTYWRQFGQVIYINLRFATVGQLPTEDRVVELGLWLEPGRIITVRRSRVLALEKAAALYQKGDGPSTSWELIAFMLSEALDRMEEGLHIINTTIEEAEERILTDDALPIDEISKLRKRLIYGQRYKMPLNILLNHISSHPSLGVTEAVGLELRGITVSFAQHQEMLDLLIDKAAALQDQIQNQLADSMNKVMFRFTWVATVFLPLGFITGLLGINVAGIPGEHDPLAFWLVCVSLIVLSIVWGIFATWITRPSKERAQHKKK